MMATGSNPETSTPDDWQKAADWLKKQRDAGHRPQVLRPGLHRARWPTATSGSPRPGPATSSRRTSSAGTNLQFVIPSEGGTLWTDNMTIPITADEPGRRDQADGLLLRPGDRGQPRRVHQLHHAGAGGPADHHSRTRPRRPVRTRRRWSSWRRARWSSRPRPTTRSCTTTATSRRRPSSTQYHAIFEPIVLTSLTMSAAGCRAPARSPYLPDPAGRPVAGRSSSSCRWSPCCRCRCSRATSSTASSRPGTGRPTPTAIANYHDQFDPLAVEYGLISTVLQIMHRVPDRVLDRVPRRRAQVDLPVPAAAAVLRLVRAAHRSRGSSSWPTTASCSAR